MSDNSTGAADDVSTNDSVNENAMDDAIENLLDKAIEDGVMAPAFDEQDEASTQDVDDDTEELEGEEDQADEDAEEVDEDKGDDAEETDESEDDEESTQDDEEEESEEDDDGEIDMDFMVPVKVDGEEFEVSMEELVKGYQTNQSQTKKGQELAEQAKELKSLQEQSILFEDINKELLGKQDERDLALLQSRKEIMDKVAAGEFVEGVDEDLATLKYQYDSLKDEYGKRKAERDGILNKMKEARKEQAQKSYTERVENFQKEIGNHVPDWDEKIAEANYAFAVEQGIPEAIVANITDPTIAKFVDDYRRLKTSASKGAVKRKKVPMKKVPAKKPVPNKVKKKTKSQEARKRLKDGNGSDKDLETLNDDVFDDIFENSGVF